ncbi:MAG: rod shape-determining protein MreC [Candidatus Babeliales bacterium]
MNKPLRFVAYFLIFLIGVFLLGNIAGSIDQKSKSVISVILYPFLKLQHLILFPFKTLSANIFTYNITQNQFDSLLVERDMLLAENIALQSSIQFKNETDELLKFKYRYQESEKKLTQIILKNFSQERCFFLVDSGSNHGIYKDMIAIYKNCLLGRVVEVYPFYSKVMLISDRNSKVAAFCTRSKTRGILEGLNDIEKVALAHVSHFEPLQENDLIISSGEGLIYPRGFGLGRIYSFKKDGVYQIVQVTPLINVEKISYCYLIGKGQEHL